MTSSGVRPIQGTDIRVAIIKMTNELPSQSGTDEVMARPQVSRWNTIDGFEPQDQLLARKGETMTTAAMVTYAYDQIDQTRTELEDPS